MLRGSLDARGLGGGQIHVRGPLSPSLYTGDHHRTANQLHSNIKFKEKKNKKEGYCIRGLVSGNEG